MKLVSGLDVVGEIACKVIEMGKGITIWKFSGELGAGKTTLVKQICQILGVKDQVKSPSFNIVHEYLTNDDEIIFHFDLYRLKNIDEALEIGMEEYLDSGKLCLIEWPEMAEELLPSPALDIKVFHSEGGLRTYQIEIT